ncbi:MAG: NTP transferase domain-containing protein [Cytophagales bacterium]|nr:NTP transferase domain-containing protein [Cytophagales bacterium]
MQKPTGGKFHRNEVAILGAPCGIIHQLVEDIQPSLAHLKMGYVDADHQASEFEGEFRKVYTDKISHHQLSFHAEDLTYQFRQVFNDTDGVIVNGNHFKAEAQIVIVNEKKRDSLQRKLDRLTDVKAILLDEGIDQPFDFLMEHLGEKQVPVFRLDDLKSIAVLIENLLNEVPPVNGLVLAGGKSTRMGHDKGAITYYDKPQREYMADLLSKNCQETYLSVLSEIDSVIPQIPDSFLDLGPFGGILSAFRKNPNSAWLAVACDVPFVDDHTINLLISQRDPSKLATCFHNPETNFPEPLITLWEPRAYPVLLHFLTLGYSCPRKVLINSEVKEIEVPNEQVLLNVNTPEEKEHAEQMIHG